MLEKKKNGYVNEIGDVLLNRVTISLLYKSQFNYHLYWTLVLIDRLNNLYDGFYYQYIFLPTWKF